jgi:hypothetical protein
MGAGDLLGQTRLLREGRAGRAQGGARQRHGPPT